MSIRSFTLELPPADNAEMEITKVVFVDVQAARVEAPNAELVSFYRLSAAGKCPWPISR